MKKDKKERYKIIFTINVVITIVLVLTFILKVRIDWLNYYEYMSVPFHIYVIKEMIIFILPAFILSVISIKLLKREK